MFNRFRFFLLLPIFLITVSSLGRATTEGAAHVDQNAVEANSCPANHARSHFYRVFGYHLDHEGKSAKAAEARKKALKIVEGWLTDSAKQGQRKEMLYICGAMRHFLQDDAAANKTFEETAKLKYSNQELKAEQNDNYNTYLETAIKEFVDLIKKGEVPKY